MPLSIPTAARRYLRPGITPRVPALFSARPPLARPLSTVVGPGNVQAATKPHFLYRAASFGGRILLFTSLGFIMAAAPAYESAKAFVLPSDHNATLDELLLDDDARAKEEYINSHPLIASLRADTDYIEERPHLRIPAPWRKHNLTGGTLAGPGKMTVPPFIWYRKDGKGYVQVTHIGTDLCGHVGIIHGGFLATMLDEGLARCCFPVLPYNVGMTAKLEIDYKAPALADQYLVLRAETVKVEGRKAWVEGHIETLPTEEGQKPTILATAKALYISPRQAATMAKLYSAS